MATKTVKISDLTGTEIRDEENLARIVVEDHPSITDAVTLEVLPEEVEDKFPEVGGYVRLSYFPAATSGGGDQTFVMTLEDFNSLSDTADMEEVLEQAVTEQQEREGRRRGRRGRRAATGERRARIDYSSPEHAGKPHRGRITEEEKEYVRNNLAEVNARLREQDLREIDPEDPDMAERYGLFSAE